MKFGVTIVVGALLAFALGLYLPWWTIALATFIVSVFVPQSSLRSFLSGFLSIGLLWGLLMVKINAANGSVLASRIAEILPFGGSVTLLILVAALVGGLTGGLAAWAGSLLRVFYSK